MALQPGRAFADGVITGRYGSEEPFDHTTLMSDVIEVLYNHHDIQGFDVDPRSYRTYGPLRVDRKTRLLRSNGQKGLIARVTKGAGALYIGDEGDEDKFVMLYFGDWAFIPSGVAFQVVSISVDESLRFLTATLVPKV